MEPETVNQLRDILNPQRKRVDFGFVMERWASLVAGTDPCRSTEGVEPIEPMENEQALVDQLVFHAPRPKRVKQLGRPRADRERYAALLLTIIFHEYTRRKPKRHSDAYKEVYTESPFYRFATASFQAIGLKAPLEILRETGERWDKSRDFNKRAMQQLLFRRPLRKRRPKTTKKFQG